MRGCTTSGRYVRILDLREGNEESSEEITGCKASVYAEFDECTRSENFIEILRFKHFARYMSFTPTKGRLFSDLLEVDKLAREWEEVNLMLDGIL